MKKITLLAVLIIAGVFSAKAQSFGLGYAYSSTAPNTGLTAHFETSIVDLGVASLNSRLRGSVFNSDGYEVGGQVFGETSVLILDASLMAKVSVIPFVNPYAGLGIAYEKTDFKFEVPNVGEVADSQNQYPLYGTIGFEFSTIPFIKPFMEYRIRAVDLKEIKNSSYDSDRWMLAIGLALSF
ncbi:hypothetical protein EP331_13210 [bacterium]|nr:MAG: hypothetical protein EP331_13210 [bacterium]